MYKSQNRWWSVMHGPFWAKKRVKANLFQAKKWNCQIYDGKGLQFSFAERSDLDHLIAGYKISDGTRFSSAWRNSGTFSNFFGGNFYLHLHERGSLFQHTIGLKSWNFPLYFLQIVSQWNCWTPCDVNLAKFRAKTSGRARAFWKKFPAFSAQKNGLGLFLLSGSGFL